RGPPDDPPSSAGMTRGSCAPRTPPAAPAVRLCADAARRATPPPEPAARRGSPPSPPAQPRHPQPRSAREDRGARAGALRRRRPPGGRPGGRRVTVRLLIADDQALVRAGFRMILDAEDDLEVVGEASDGREAVAQAGRLKPDVVLMDIRMPELDGIEATRRV